MLKKFDHDPKGFLFLCMWVLAWILLPSACSTPIYQIESTGIETVKTLSERTYLGYDWKVAIGDNADYASADYDDSQWQSLTFPINGYPYAIKKSNFFWFRKHFYVSDNLRGESLGYFSGKLPEATELYFNGALIGTSGSMPPDNYYGNSCFTRSFILPDGLINYGGKNVVAMRVYTEKSNGDLKLPFVTNNTDRITTFLIEYTFNTALPNIVTFLALIVASYFFLMYIRNNKERFNLYIGIALVGVAIWSSGLTFEYMPINFTLINKIWYSALFIGECFFVFYFLDFYNIHNHPAVKIVLFSATLISCVTFWMAPDLASTMFLIYNVFYVVLLSPMNIYILVLSIMAWKRGNPYARILFVGVLLVILTAFHDMFYAFFFQEPVMWLTNLGIGLWIFTLYLNAANRFMDTKNKAEELNIELSQQKNAFFRFVPSQFLSLLGKESAIDITLGNSSLKRMSVLFSDIRKFTSLSEELSPDQSFDLLNAYLMMMESPITENQGFVDKYVGDAIMALFAELESDPSDLSGFSSADKAVKAAIGMRRNLLEFNRNQKLKHNFLLNNGVGINTGSLMLGTVGSSHRLDTTVIGDSVNLAARLEKLTQYYRVSIIISHMSFNALTHPEEFDIRELDLVTVKGRNEPCLIYDVFSADPDNLKENKLATMELLSEGIMAYRDKKFREAHGIFKKMREKSPDDILPVLYMKRCLEYVKNPPSEQWNASFRVHY
ncbi:MAG: hypothetical protein JXR70_01855 [Spirochaetales bacterium]|nr:hypothetical protein [Spirochaetales bacterium]